MTRQTTDNPIGTPAAPPREDFLGLPLCPVTPDGLIDWLLIPDAGTVPPRAAAYLNAHTVNLALRRGSKLRSALCSFDMVYADGMSVVREGRRRGLGIGERVSAADFLPRFCWAAAARGRTLAFVGGRPGIAASCAAALAERVPGLRILFHHHGHFPEGGPEERLVLDSLRKHSPDVTLLGLGSPRQELLALRLRDQECLNATWCVGALFEYYAPGVRRHAPLWMRRAGLEWLFRLSQEPSRLARRYLLGNIEFQLRCRGILDRTRE